MRRGFYDYLMRADTGSLAVKGSIAGGGGIPFGSEHSKSIGDHPDIPGRVLAGSGDSEDFRGGLAFIARAERAGSIPAG